MVFQVNCDFDNLVINVTRSIEVYWMWWTMKIYKALRTVYAHWHDSTVSMGIMGMATSFFFFFSPFQNSLYRAVLIIIIKKMSWLLCCLIQAITRANSEGNSVPGEGKIYILGWNMKIMLLMRAVHDKNQIMKPKGWKQWRCRQVVAKATCTEEKNPKLLVWLCKGLDNRINYFDSTMHSVSDRDRKQLFIILCY